MIQVYEGDGVDHRHVPDARLWYLREPTSNTYYAGMCYGDDSPMFGAPPVDAIAVSISEAQHLFNLASLHGTLPMLDSYEDAQQQRRQIISDMEPQNSEAVALMMVEADANASRKLKQELAMFTNWQGTIKVGAWLRLREELSTYLAQHPTSVWLPDLVHFTSRLEKLVQQLRQVPAP